MLATTQTGRQEVRPVLQGQDILWIQHLVRQVPTSQHMVDYAVDLARATRPKETYSPDFVKKWLAWGAGPRAAQYLILGAKARAIIHGRFAVSADDIRAMAHPVLRHRIFTNFNADAEGVDVNDVVTKILETVGEPSYGETIPAGLPRTRSSAGRAVSDAATTPAAAPQYCAGPRAALFAGRGATAGRSAQPADSAAAAIEAGLRCIAAVHDFAAAAIDSAAAAIDWPASPPRRCDRLRPGGTIENSPARQCWEKWHGRLLSKVP